jgi:DNA-binding transcriptional regulator PaaX
MSLMKKNEIAKMILGGLALAGGLIIIVALPGLALAFRPFVKKNISGAKFKRSFQTLKEKGLIGTSKEGDKTVVHLTKEGQMKVLKYKFEDISVKKPAKWDKKWRIVVFDIPEKYKAARDALVQKLKELGFVSVQKSVWVYPYPCTDEIDFITEIFNIRRFVRLVTAESIDRQQDLQKAFSLQHTYL